VDSSSYCSNFGMPYNLWSQGCGFPGHGAFLTWNPNFAFGAVLKKTRFLDFLHRSGNPLRFFLQEPQPRIISYPLTDGESFLVLFCL
jgi:hypothetical protein